ncbi:MAG: HisA/HisF-related TIM barrel protein [Candidatus Bathyarchaeia archaeon]
MNLKIIPVIDILNGAVVHAVKGKRSEYRPIQSVVCDSSVPLQVAQAFKALGFGELYVADLDAIIDCSSNFQALKRLADGSGLNLMVDAGVTSMDRAESLLSKGVSKLVVGTETLQNKGFVGEAVKRFGSERLIVSLDLNGDKVLAKPGFDGCADPLCLLREFKSLGVSQVIVLDLARVGSGEGVNVDFLGKVQKSLTLNVYVGGGVRGISDLVELKNLGVSGVLVASALHSGKISVEELRKAKLLK